MKKAFIQKLSIAMASALVITAAVPATSADAAAAMKINKSSKILYLNEDNVTNTSNEEDFYIKNKPSNYKSKYSFNWYAEDDTIVDVAKGGVVTAKKVGQTVVKCDITKKSTGKVYKTLKTTVTVKANAETITITNLPENGAMTIGTTWDFNRTMKAANGGKATDKTQWILSADAEGTKATDIATVDQKTGKVTATKAGTFYVSARTYQSNATKDTTTAETAEAFKVTVAASITEIKNVTSSKIEVTFDDNMSALKAENFTVTNALGVKQNIKGVGYSADGKVATVELWTPMTDKAVYKVSATDVKEVTFTASIGAPKSIVVSNSVSVQANAPTKLTYQLFDEAGVEVSKGTNARVEFSTTTTTDAWINNNETDDNGNPCSKITIFNIDKSVPVKATYYTGTYDAYGSEIKFDSDVVVLRSVKSLDAVVSSAATATITSKEDGKAADWTKVTTTLPVSDTDKYLQIKYVKSDGKEAYTNNSGDVWTFESTDTSRLIVNPSTGKLLPLKEGPVVVIAKCGTFTTSFSITISTKRVAASVTADTSNFTLSNQAGLGDSKTVKFTIKDNYGDDYTADTNKVKVEVLGNDAANTKARTAIKIEEDVNSVKFTSNGLADYAGTYTFKLTKCDKVNIVTVVVVDPAEKVSYAQVQVDTTSFDTKVTSGSELGKITVSLNKIATNGVNKGKITNNVSYVVKHSDGTEVGTAYTNLVNGELEISPVIVSGTGYSKLKVGTYTVSAKVNNSDLYVDTDDSNIKKSIMGASFEIKDTQTTATVKTKSLNLEMTALTSTTEEAVKSALATCFELDDKTNRTFEVTSIKSAVKDNLVNKEVGVYSVFVEKVTVTEKIAGLDLKTEVAVNTTITVTVKK